MPYYKKLANILAEEFESLVPQIMFVSATPGPYELESTGGGRILQTRQTSSSDEHFTVAKILLDDLAALRTKVTPIHHAALRQHVAVLGNCQGLLHVLLDQEQG